MSGDLNGDGRPDIVTWDSHFSVYLTHGSSYRAAPVVPFGNVLDHGRAHSAAIADFDEDGRNDVVLTSDSAFIVLRNLGDGTFEPYAVSPGAMKGGRVLDADGDGWLDVIGLGRQGVHVVRNVCAPPRVRLTVIPSAPREGESATIHLQSLALFPYGFDITHNGVWMHGGSEKFQTLAWTTPPLPAGSHTFTGQVLDRLAPTEAAEKKIYVDPPGGRRRTVRQ